MVGHIVWAGGGIEGGDQGFSDHAKVEAKANLSVQFENRYDSGLFR